MMSGLAETTATKLLSSALSRAGSTIFQKIIRLKKVDAAIRGERLKNKSLETALRDYETITGSYHGELTVTLDRFLRELECTGLLTVIADEAILKRRKPSTKTAFLNLHRQIVGAADELGESLYTKLFTSFEASLQLLMKDDALAYLVRASTEQLESRLRTVNDQLELLTRGLGPSSHAAILDTLQRQSRGLTSQFRTIRIETNRGAKLIDINRIYIPPKLRERREPKFPVGIDFNRQRELAHFRHEQTTPLSYADFRGGFNRVVVLGDPGGGKSTLCQYLCYDLARQTSLQLQHPDRRDFEPNTQKLPLRVVLRSYERARQHHPQISLFDFIFNEIHGLDNGEIPQTREALLYILNYGRAIIAFDGLDEILNTARRREFVQMVTAFCDRFPLCPVIITSRLVGYEDAPLGADFEELVLEKFDVNEIHAYLVKFLRVVAQCTKEEAAAGANKFINQTNQTAPDLRQNPLLLGLMAFLFVVTGDVPSNRPEIYRECAILMFERWDKNRDIKPDIPAGFDLLHLFSTIAAKVFGDPALEEGVSRDWLEKHNQIYFRDLFENRAKANDAAKLVAEFITGRSWVMSEFGPNVYKFTHRTFLEYFFARHIDEEHDTVADLMKILRPKVIRNEWDVIAHLALQLKTYRNQRRIAQALAVLGEQTRRIRRGQFRNGLLSFSARALEYLSGTEQDVKQAAIAICEEVFKEGNQIGTKELDPVALCCNCCVERREFVQSVVEDFLVTLIERGAGELVEAACYLVLISLVDEPYWRGAESQVRLPRNRARAVRQRAEAALRNRVSEGVEFARGFWELYRKEFRSLYEIYGMELFSGRKLQAVSDSVEPALRLFINVNNSSPEDRDALYVIGDSEFKENSVNRAAGPRERNLFIGDDHLLLIVRSLIDEPKMLRGALILFIFWIDTEKLLRRGIPRPTRYLDNNMLRAIEEVIADLPGDLDFTFYWRWKQGSATVLA